MATGGQKQQAVLEFYDSSTEAWVELFGEHMHEGYYEPGTAATKAVHRAATVQMIDEALRFADVSAGIAIAPKEIRIAKDRAAAQGLESKVSFDVGDALDMPYPDGTFDLILTIDCIENIQDKDKVIREMVRVAAPGAAIVMLSYAHRNLSPSEKSLKPREKELLKKICDKHDVPPFCSLADYVGWLKPLPVEDIKTADWTQNVTPFYSLCWKEAFTWKGITSFLMKAGWRAIKFLLAVRMMSKAADDGLFKFVAITCRKAK